MSPRWIFVILMVMLPFQAAWATASRYCQHEQGSASQHFGHHYHQHATGSSDSKPTPSGHTDCGYCHVDNASLPFAALPDSDPVVDFRAYRPALRPIPFVVPDEPERPKWSRLA